MGVLYKDSAGIIKSSPPAKMSEAYYKDNSGIARLVWKGGGAPTQLRLADLPVGALVKFKIDNADRKHIIVQHGKPSNIYDDSFNNTTTLLTQGFYPTKAWAASGNDYANSTIHSYLNNDFLALVDPIVREKIKQVKIPYRPGSGTSKVINSGANGLPVYAWLLSGYELNWTTDVSAYFVADGATMSYFSGTAVTDTKRIAIPVAGGSASVWWTRSPYISSTLYAWRVSAVGANTYGSTTTLNGVRPALTFPSNTPVFPEPDTDGAYILL